MGCQGDNLEPPLMHSSKNLANYQFVVAYKVRMKAPQNWQRRIRKTQNCLLGTLAGKTSLWHVTREVLGLLPSPTHCSPHSMLFLSSPVSLDTLAFSRDLQSMTLCQETLEEGRATSPPLSRSRTQHGAPG